MGLFSHHLFKIDPIPGSPISRPWMHYALSASWIGVAVRAFANGTTVNMLPADAFDLPKVPVPRAGVVEAFDGLVRGFHKRMEGLREENRTLAALRDALLPKLMSGELRVREAETLIAEAV
jgi:hypothetical protein